MNSMFFELHSKKVSIISSMTVPDDRARKCSLAGVLLMGQRKAFVAKRVFPPPASFSNMITAAPAS